MSFDANKILKKFNLRQTECRLEVLNIFNNHKVAISHNQIENSLNGKFDRVTLYRTLATFQDSGIIHRVLDNSDSAIFALCADSCDTHKHHDNHVHFKCRKCHKSECLDKTTIPPISIPLGYKAEHANMLIEGVCPACV
jgi:Fur family ferric uptake transcriptional regulator